MRPIRIRFNPDHGAYSLWDPERACYVNKWGKPDPSYHCVSRGVAVMRRRDLNEYRKQDARRAEARKRLEYLRGELRAERISYGEIIELQGLAPFIPRGDVELLEAAGVPEECVR